MCSGRCHLAFKAMHRDSLMTPGCTSLVDSYQARRQCAFGGFVRNICTATTATLLLSTVANRGMSHCYSPYEERKKRLNDFWVKLQSEILKFNAMICAIQLHLLDCDRVFVLGPYKKCVCVSDLCKIEKIQYQVIKLNQATQ